MIYTNATTAIKNLTVYFNDAVPVSIISNGVLVLPTKTINYTTSGNKVLKFVATFTDNSSITTVGYHYFAYQPQSIAARLAASIACEGPIVERGMYKSIHGFQGYDETVAYLGKFDYTVFYRTKNQNGTLNTSQRNLIKPILIIDGFDPGDTRRTTDCDYEQDTSDDGCFSKNSAGGVFNYVKYESIFDLMEFQENGVTVNLVNKLKAEGYDVIILNIPKYTTSAVGSAIENKSIDGGGDYIERNGITLASYIQYVNGKLKVNASTERLVIMGPSMGGLISRYALAFMEKKQAEAIVQTDKDKWKDYTRIWVSFDAPNLGANIPMGAQANIWFFGNKLRNVAAKDKFDNQLNSVAGKQLLISQFSNTLATMTNGTGNSNNSPYFVRFYNDLKANGVVGSGGFPVSTSSFRKIAIVNGSLSGSKSSVESAEFLNIRGYKDPTITEGLISGAIVGSVVPGFGTIAGAVIGSLLGSSKANVTVLRCRNKFYPNTGITADIFNGDGQAFVVGFNVWDTSHKWFNLRAINNDIRGSLDVVPAGTFTTGKILREEIVKGLTDLGLSNEIRSTPIDTHSFIPTFSALAHLQPNQNWSNPLNTNLICLTNRLTPFDSYFGQNTNTPHISLSKEMVVWLMKELGTFNISPVPQAPSFPIDQNALTGLAKICVNSTGTYNFADICKVPSAATWSVSSNMQILSSNGYGLTVKALSDGAGTVTATFQNGKKIIKSIQIGASSIVTNNMVGPAAVNYNETHNYRYAGRVNSPSSTYKWFIYNGINDGTGPDCGGQIVSGQGGRSIYLETGCNTGFLIVEVTATSPCDMVETAFIYVDVSNPFARSASTISSSTISTFSNPMIDSSNLQVNVIKTDAADTIDDFPKIKVAAKAINNQVKVYDFYGNLKYSTNFTSDKMSLHNLNLKSGQYILNVTTNSGEQLKTVIFVK